MTGEINELCILTANARCALKSGEMNYTVRKYINSEKFVFISRNSAEIVEDSAVNWFGRLRSFGLNDIIMLLPQSAEGREIHGFINSSGGCIVCFFESGEVTYFTTKWKFDDEKRGWNVEFTENKCDNPPEGKPRFSDNTEEFKSALLGIAEFAEKIDQSFWSGIFRKALGMLDGSLECENADLPDLPERNLRLYCAAGKADVFGGMGSWNDTPPIYVAENGLSEEYKRFSNELFIQIQKALVFAVNMF